MGLKALGGAPLVGHKLVRLIYLDESGTSAREEVAAVGGVVVNFDKDLVRLEDALATLASETVPEEFREEFIFHATEIFFGAKKDRAFAKISTMDAQRWPVLKRLSAIPSRLGLPIVVGYVRKDRSMSDIDEDTWYGLAFVFAMIAVDQYMKECAPPDEFALVVAANKPKIQRAIKRSQKLLKTNEAAERFPGLSNQLPITRIKDTVHFAEIADSPALQSADSTAFVWRRFFEGKPDSAEFMEALLDGRASPPPDHIRGQKEGFGHVDWSGRAGKLIPFR